MSKKKLIFSFIIFSVFLYLPKLRAQAEEGAYWGININTHLVIEKGNGSSIKLLPPPDLYLHAGIMINRYAGIELYAGYIIFSSAWSGFDLGCSLKSFLSEKLFVYMNLSHNNSSSWGTNSISYYCKEFWYGGPGAGYFVSKNSYVTLSYVKNLSRDNVFGYNILQRSYITLSGRLTFGIGWNF